MAQFDPVAWRSQALARLRRALLAGKTGASAAYLVDLDSIDHLQAAVTWCVATGIAVNFDHRGGALHDGNAIRVNRRALPEHQLHLLLHECGHWLVDASGQRQSDFTCGYAATDPGLKKTDRHRVDVVAEELEAWRQGKQLALQLGINLDGLAYDRTRARCIKSYMKWCVHPGAWDLVND